MPSPPSYPDPPLSKHWPFHCLHGFVFSYLLLSSPYSVFRPKVTCCKEHSMNFLEVITAPPYNSKKFILPRLMAQLELVDTIIGPWARDVFMLFSGLWFQTKSNHFIIRTTFNSENALNVSLTWEITKNIRLYSFTLNNYIIIFILLLYNYNYIQLQKYKFSLICRWD